MYIWQGQEQGGQGESGRGKGHRAEGILMTCTTLLVRRGPGPIITNSSTSEKWTCTGTVSLPVYRMQNVWCGECEENVDEDLQAGTFDSQASQSHKEDNEKLRIAKDKLKMTDLAKEVKEKCGFVTAIVMGSVSDILVGGTEVGADAVSGDLQKICKERFVEANLSR